MDVKNSYIYLAQTDTTAGFLSKNKELLNRIKNRALNKPCIITIARLCELQNFTHIPNKYKNLVRKAKKTSFIYPNGKTLRVVHEGKHRQFLLENGWFYSSSANAHGKKFDEAWAKKIIDKNKGIILDEEFFEGRSSVIYKLSRLRRRKIR
ncbi:Sua5 YciO YrdC YwlC family protein [Campylobacter sp. MIT 21-1685]|uniref:Sua5 YciO YrdC YwlC family protein n=1 Tax=unclassified Campylobacter TaxID=2593542 RepID=UPI00224AA6F0|nr:MULTISPECIES: Sua5 YciO YrdC YwlC family protein [unclassified Campylobacter]MCX2682627.1 Sua5 YciO YrdC YwlC family protein [Campylobacter sp. MIT 21-1684]MCX2750907.1 Sua5 YciO YrdC YwlC family protein [Campylobacter sp. MIT 21-1682]MCX2807160.1 Sua5 YciO YrdC YwlC family protein [Campylobacter sp. MIT 21-1685]